MTKSNTAIKKRINIHTLTLVGLMSAVICILGPLSIPIGPVPISFTNLAIFMTVILLGKKLGTISYMIYLLIGFIGLPVFSGFTGGAGKLFGPTGGYLIGFIFLAWITGFFVERFSDKIGFYIIGMLLGSLITYVFGTAWLSFLTHMDLRAALMVGVIPFIPGDICKILIAVIITPMIKRPLVKAGIL
ncbi:MAG: biotin transporter BioY [Lachnospiraceae bacterium]